MRGRRVVVQFELWGEKFGKGIAAFSGSLRNPRINSWHQKSNVEGPSWSNMGFRKKS